MPEHSLKSAAYSATALGFVSFGDAFLYAYLPLNYSKEGVPLLWVGVLLSINRIARIFSNIPVAYLCSRYGLRTLTLIAVVMAIASTFGYWLSSSVLVWVGFRILWGLSFSVLRTSTIGYAIQNQHVGTALGVSRSLQEAGPMVALFTAPFLLNEFMSKDVFLVLGVASLPGIWFAFRLPRDHENTEVPYQNLSLRFPSPLNLLTFISAIVIDGLLVIVLGALFLRDGHGISLLAATSLAAFYLGYRRVCMVTLSPVGGWLAEKFGMQTVFNASLGFVVVGLLLIAAGQTGAGAIIVFTGYSVHVTVTPGAIAANSKQALLAVGKNASWRDVGAAMGTIAGGLLIHSPVLSAILLLAGAVLFILLLLNAGFGKTLANLILWR
jgi:predicted MFS family arabinose efflux permease